MNKQTYTVMATILIAGCMAVSARAQCGSIEATANIPFQFSLDQKTLPAGQYRITCEASGYGAGVIRLTDGNASVKLVAVTVIGKARDHGVLVFHQYGNRYFLAQFWLAGEEMGQRLPESRAERELKRELATIKPNNETVALNRGR